jgi:hypothetical protein
MPRLGPWRWWAGNEDSVDHEGVFDLGDFDGREEAIRAANRQCETGERFYIVEARLWVRFDAPPDGIERFARERGRELLTARLVPVDVPS